MWLTTSRYAASKKAKPGVLFRDFNTEKFWRVAEQWAKHNLVFISEESAPSKNWVVVWEKDYRRSAANQKKNTSKYTDRGEEAPKARMSKEKLFVWYQQPDPSAFKRPKYPF